jgi:hypothetical protein
MPLQATARSNKLVLIPGWNESAADLRVVANGRNGNAGLASYGFDHVVFAAGEGSLSDRIVQFGAFLAGLKAREPEAFPVATLGYSAGGLINRGFVRAFPERAHEVCAVVQVGTPNWGLVTDNVAMLLNAMRMSRSVIADIDIESPFMAWLNETPGHWEPIAGTSSKRWRLDGPPTIAPAGTDVVNIIGRIPRRNMEGDDLVDVRSATLDGAVEHRIIDDARANHLNLSGMWSVVTWLFRRWSCDDRVWPLVVQHASEELLGPVRPYSPVP